MIRRVMRLATALLMLEGSCGKPEPEPGGSEMTAGIRVVAGDFLVWQGQGLVHVEGSRQIERTSVWVMKSVQAGTSMVIPIDSRENVIRRPVSRSEADRLVVVLRQQTGASDDRPWAVRFHEAMVSFLKRPLDAQVNALHTLYRTRYALTLGERKLIDMFEQVIVGELAHVLGKNVDAMVVELRSGHPAFSTSSPERPPDPILAEPPAPMVLENHSYLGKISSSSGRFVVGEMTAPDNDTYAAQGNPGEWHAYVREPSDHDEGELLLIHGDALGKQDTLLHNLVTITELKVAGGTMAMTSAEARHNESFQEAAMFPVDPIVQGRGCVVHAGGDGVHRLRGAKIADRFAVLVVDL